MGNSFFQFKQFRINQDRCAMKVCTDSCLFGAWIPLGENTQHILDIGTGTGLLSLIMAQRSNATIDAVEIEEDAYEQASENFAASEWADRIHIFHTDILQLPTTKKYGLVICNPPFYENSLPSSEQKEKIAKHQSGLTLENLLQATTKLISEQSKLALLLPYFRKDEINSRLIKYGWHVEQETAVKNKKHQPCFRYMVYAGRQAGEKNSTEIIIYESGKTYTAEFTELLSHLYL